MSKSHSSRTFLCVHCGANIKIPVDLQPTMAPCPKCGEKVMSPSLDEPSAEPSAEAKELEEVGSGEAAKESGRMTPAMMVAIAVAVLLIVGVMIFSSSYSSGDEEVVAKDPEAKFALNSLENPAEQEAMAKLFRKRSKEAEEVLTSFLAAETVQERASWTIAGSQNEAAMAAIYEKFEEDAYRTPASAFNPVNLNGEDSKRGIFLLEHKRPEQFALRYFFRPIPPIRVKYGLERPENWLLAEAAASNFVDRPLNVLAFFRESPEGLKLDWATYAQTRFRLFEEFKENPEAGKMEVFRVIVQEDVAWDEGGNTESSVFRFSDPSVGGDFVKIRIPNESELGHCLDSLRWSDRVVSNVPVRYATISLLWSDEAEPKLQVGKFICWEFLHLGGESGNWKQEGK